MAIPERAKACGEPWASISKACRGTAHVRTHPALGVAVVPNQGTWRLKEALEDVAECKWSDRLTFAVQHPSLLAATGVRLGRT
eukprot:scaffold7917_cov61-Phaeocystis_antarctica.AAC.5